MELGQTICLPRAPRCPVCPCRKWCEAYRRKQPENYPAPRPRRATELHHLAVAIVRHGSNVALARGLDDGLMEDLWNFPAAFGGTAKHAVRNLETKLTGLFDEPVRIGGRHGEIRHTITHRAIRVQIYGAETHKQNKNRLVRWFAPSKLHHAAISQLTRKVALYFNATNEAKA